MSLYQFLIAVRTSDGVLTSMDGETTRFFCGLHIFFNRHCKLQSSCGDVLSNNSYGGKWNKASVRGIFAVFFS